jgi:hypothetical protein
MASDARLKIRKPRVLGEIQKKAHFPRCLDIGGRNAGVAQAYKHDLRTAAGWRGVQQNASGRLTRHFPGVDGRLAVDP